MRHDEQRLTHTVHLQPSAAQFTVATGEAILSAARRQGLICPQSCRNGVCHLCAATLLAGCVKQQGMLHHKGQVLTCIAQAVGDCELLWEGVLVGDELQVAELSCQVIACEDLGGDVVRVLLRTPAGRQLRYHAGQYILLERAEGEYAAYSLASIAQQARLLELHILARDSANVELIKRLRSTAMARVQMPFGDAHLARLPDGPLVLVGAGTGMAQMQSLLEHCRAVGFDRPIDLYWGVRHEDDFYALPYWQQWQQMDNLRLHQVVSDSVTWSGRRGLLHQAIREDFADLGELTLYVSGSPAMVYGTLDALQAAGLDKSQMHADVFAYAPRETD